MNKYALFYLTALLASTPSLASSIPALFPYAAQSHDPKGKVDMKGAPKITGTNHGVLDFGKNDNLEGECDNGSCSISGNTVSGLTLQWPNDWAFNEPWSGRLAPLPEFFNNTAPANPLVCDWNNNQNATFSSAVYQSVSVQNRCKIDAKKAKVRIQGKLEVSGIGTLQLAPGHYYMDELTLTGNAGIEASPAGAIYLYVKNELELDSSRALGTTNSPVNLVYYGQDDAQIKRQLVGSLNTHAHLQMSGSANLNQLIQAKSLTMQGSAQVTLLPGSYWLEKLDLQGSARIIQPEPGDINMYVKDNVNVKISTLGAGDRRINIRNYNTNVDFGSNLTFHGDLYTHDALKLHKANFYGAVRAKELDLQESAELYLAAGEYWYEDIKLQGSSKIHLAGETILHIKDELDLEGSTSINATSSKPLFIVVHGEKNRSDEGEVDLEGSSEIHGYLYVQGEVELQGSSKIVGAVNVVDLEMEGSSAIIYKAFSFAEEFEELHHYRLFFNSQNKKFQATSCVDSNCYVTYGRQVRELHIKNNLDNNATIVNFKRFEGQSSPTSPNGSSKLNQCVQLAIHKASPWPASSPALRCWKDGVPLTDCKLCPDSQEPEALAGFVFGEVTITEAHLKGLATGASLTLGAITGNGNLTTNGQPLTTKGSSLNLPLTVSYDKAEVVEMQIKAKKGQQEQTFNLNLLFVPKSLAWVTASNLDCGANKKNFVYLDHAETCTVLGRAGSEVKLTLQAYGEADAQGKPRVIPNYQAGLGKIIQLQELSAAHQPYVDEADKDLLDLQFESKNGAGHGLTYSVQQVGLIKATVQAHYAPLGDNAQNNTLVTQGDSIVLGRTVPDRLLVTADSGKIKNGAAYRGKAIEYQENEQGEQQFPYFSIKACAVGQQDVECELPSYTGEFAGGLDKYTQLTETLVDAKELQWKHLDDASGEHIFRPDPAFIFDKVDPKKEQSLYLPLELMLAEHDQLGSTKKQAHFADKNDSLRFGFVTLMDSEIKVGEAGTMASKLNYYGENLNRIKEDGVTDYRLSNGGTLNAKLQNGTELPDLSLSLNDKKVNVAPFDREQKDITVKIEGLPNWLKPANQNEAGKLTDPSAMLDILTDPRLRANDSTFNRREVFR